MHAAPDIPDFPAPGRDFAPAAGRYRAGRRVLTAVAVLVVLVGASAVVGAAAGFAWIAVAPRALLVATGGGGADVVNSETSAFIAADGWFVVLSVLGGAVCGLLGWLLAVRRHGAVAMLGLLGGGLAAALAARSVGQHAGLAAFNHKLAVSKPGTLLREPLSIGGHGAIAFWPLAAGLVAGGIEAAGLLRDRRLAAARRLKPALAPAEPARPERADGW